MDRSFLLFEYIQGKGHASFSRKLFETKSETSESNIMKFKLEHGVFFECKAIRDYDLFMSNKAGQFQLKSLTLLSTLTTPFSRLLSMAK